MQNIALLLFYHIFILNQLLYAYKLVIEAFPIAWDHWKPVHVVDIPVVLIPIEVNVGRSKRRRITEIDGEKCVKVKQRFETNLEMVKIWFLE